MVGTASFPPRALLVSPSTRISNLEYRYVVLMEPWLECSSSPPWLLEEKTATVWVLR